MGELSRTGKRPKSIKPEGLDGDPNYQSDAVNGQEFPVFDG